MYISEKGKISDPVHYSASLTSAYQILDVIFKNEDTYRLNLYEQAFAAKRLEADQLFYTYARPAKKTGDANKAKP